MNCINIFPFSAICDDEFIFELLDIGINETNHELFASCSKIEKQFKTFNYEK